MKAIFKRELQAYFKTPVGYIFVGMFLLVAAFFFIMYTLLSGIPTVDSIFYNLLSIFMFLIPILTMRLISEERNKKTDQILLTSPVSTTSIVLGKFFAACVVYFIALAFTLLFLVVIAFHGEIVYLQTLCTYLGFILLGMSLIAIGLFISSLTENQIVAAVITFVVFMLIYLFTSLKDMISSPALSWLFSALSVMVRFDEFNLGILSISGIVYYLSITAVFITLTCHTLESRRFK